jgi:hypothetical protein
MPENRLSDKSIFPGKTDGLRSKVNHLILLLSILHPSQTENFGPGSRNKDPDQSIIFVPAGKNLRYLEEILGAGFCLMSGFSKTIWNLHE